METITQHFLATKLRTLSARARRLARLTPASVGLRRQDLIFAPSSAHFRAANQRLTQIDRAIVQRLRFLRRHWPTAPAARALVYIALVERDVDRARRAFGLFFEVFSQRGSSFAAALAAHDVIAADCYQAIRQAAPQVFSGALLAPLTYMEHGYSPATMRRGVTLSRLLGESNPFPLIRIPWNRDAPWQPVFLHEVAHNLQADLGLWQENKDALNRRLLGASGDPLTVTVYSRWHKEIFADLAAVLLGGPAAVWGMMDFLAHPGAKTLNYRPGGAHPTGYLRVPIMAELLRRLGFNGEARQVTRVWRDLYRPGQGHRLPPQLLHGAASTIPHVVDEIAFQTRRNLAQRALADVIPFGAADERRIRQAAAGLLRNTVSRDLPPRFLMSASRYALAQGADAARLSRLTIDHLAGLAGRTKHNAAPPLAVAA